MWFLRIVQIICLKISLSAENYANSCHNYEKFITFAATMVQFILLLIAAFGLGSQCLAQERTDSISLVDSLHVGSLTEKDILELQQPLSPADVRVGDDMLRPSHNDLDRDLPLHPDLEPRALPLRWYGFSTLRRGDYLPSWSTGAITGSHATYGDRLNGYTSYATMGVRQSLGEYWTLNAGLSLQKTMFYNAASFDAMLTYHPSKYFSLTGFASYMPGSFMSPIQLMPSFEWGGFATFQTDTDLPFGIDLGARDEYDQMSGHYVTPIVRPFVKVGESKLGIDFGPLLDGALHKDNRSFGGHGMNPIPQPIKAMPQVAPRR